MRDADSPSPAADRPVAAVVAAAASRGRRAAAADVPPDHLPRYDLDLTIDTDKHKARLRQTRHLDEHDHDRRRTTSPSTSTRTTASREGDYLHLAKTLEMLRLQPSLRHRPRRPARRHQGGAAHRARRASRTTRCCRTSSTTTTRPRCAFPLPRPVEPRRVGDGRTRLRRIHLPNKQGRLGPLGGRDVPDELAAGRSRSTTTRGWQPMPFVPWHQPFCNEAGVYTRHDHAAGGRDARLLRRRSKSETNLGDGRKRVETRAVRRPRLRGPVLARLQGVHRPRRKLPDGKTVAAAVPRVRRSTSSTRREILKIVGEAIPVYSQWFGPFPYDAVHHRRVVLRVERQRVRRPRHDRRARLRHAAPRPRVRRVPRLARDLPPVVVQPRRHQRLRRDVHGRGGGRRTSRTGCSTRSAARTTRSWTGRRAWSGCRTSTARTTATAACTTRSATARCTPRRRTCRSTAGTAATPAPLSEEEL